MNVWAKLKIIIMMFILITITYDWSGQAQDNSSDKQVAAMLKEFYTNYILGFSKISPAQIQKLNLVKAKYCTASLIARIEKQLKSGELDYDPFLKTQDVETAWLKTLAFKKDSHKTDLYIVSYIDNINRNKIDIHLTVLKQSGRFKIAAVW